jgi:hypothetical protein
MLDVYACLQLLGEGINSYLSGEHMALKESNKIY